MFSGKDAFELLGKKEGIIYQIGLQNEFFTCWHLSNTLFNIYLSCCLFRFTLLDLVTYTSINNKTTCQMLYWPLSWEKKTAVICDQDMDRVPLRLMESSGSCWVGGYKSHRWFCHVPQMLNLMEICRVRMPDQVIYLVFMASLNVIVVMVGLKKVRYSWYSSKEITLKEPHYQIKIK